MIHQPMFLFLFCILLLGSAPVVLSYGAYQVGSPWPQSRGLFNNNTALSPYYGSQRNTTKWTFSTTGGFQYVTPAIDSSGNIYLTNSLGYLYAMSSTGSNLWKWSTGVAGYFSSCAIGVDGTLYLSLAQNYLCAVSSTGSLKWKYLSYGGTTYSMFNPIIGTDGTIYVGSSDGYFSAVTTLGSAKWCNYFATGGIIAYNAAQGPDTTLYYVTKTSPYYLRAVTTTGSLIWSYTMSSLINGPPAVVKGNIYVWLQVSGLLVVNPVGSLLWKAYPSSTFVPNALAFGSDGTIYGGSRSDPQIYAIYSWGSLKWKYATGNYIYSSPAVGSDGTIYCGSNDNSIYALTSWGSLLWSYRTNGVVYGSPAIGADGSVYIGSGDMTIYAFTKNIPPNPTNAPTFVPSTISPSTVSPTAPTLAPTRGGPVVWSHYRGISSNHSGVSSYAGPANVALGWRLTLSSLGNVDYSSPVIAPDGTIYVGIDSGYIVAITNWGSINWQLATVGAPSSVTLVSTKLYFGTSSNSLYSVQAWGSVSWTYATNGWTGVTTVDSSTGVIYVGTATPGNSSYAFNSWGSLKWKVSTGYGGSQVVNAPTIRSDGNIYVGSGVNNLYLLSRTTGSTIWKYTTGGLVGTYTTPLIGSDSSVYITCQDGYLYSITSLGSLKWKTNGGGLGSAKTSPTLGSDGNIYVAYTNAILSAVPTTGSYVVKTVSYAFNSAPVVGADGKFYIGGASLVAYSPSLGSVLWTYTPQSGTFVVQPAIGSDSTLIAVDTSARVYSFLPGTLSSLSKFHRVKFDHTGITC